MGLRAQAGPGQQCSSGGVWETGILGEWTEVSQKDSQVALSELSPDCCLFHPPLPLPKFLSSAGSSGGQGAGRRSGGAAPVPLPLSQSPPFCPGSVKNSDHMGAPQRPQHHLEVGDSSPTSYSLLCKGGAEADFTRRPSRTEVQSPAKLLPSPFRRSSPSRPPSRPIWGWEA